MRIRTDRIWVSKRTAIALASFMTRPHDVEGSNIQQTIKTMKLFESLRKIREFERLELFFFKSPIDFDIVIEIGYAQEQKPLTPKQLFLLELSSLTTVRRRLKRLIDQGIVKRRANASDHRFAILTISPSSLKLLSKYVGVLTAVCNAK